MSDLVLGHLYPDYLNIYADRGNIAVLMRRAEWRGLHVEVRAIGLGQPVPLGEVDLLYIGGGQDREQALVAPNLAAKGPAMPAGLQPWALPDARSSAVLALYQARAGCRL